MEEGDWHLRLFSVFFLHVCTFSRRVSEHESQVRAPENGADYYFSSTISLYLKPPHFPPNLCMLELRGYKESGYHMETGIDNYGLSALKQIYTGSGFVS